MKELRIGLVLYGGASLAVYMNGIVTELWHALRASQARQGGDRAALDGTAPVYARLLDALSETRDVADLRIVVDAVAGTSAGGVNGAALAKAVVDGGDASVLSDVWISEAQLEEGRLRGEPQLHAPMWLRFLSGSVTTLFPAARKLRGKVDGLQGASWDWAVDQAYSFLVGKDGRRTILDGRYFSRMIARSFARMMARPGTPLLPRHGTFDLFLTRTDVHGWPRHLPMSARFTAEPLYERTHGHRMHFERRPGAGESDGPGFALGDGDLALTFATRTTAGFPVAFAPVSYDDVVADFYEERPDVARPAEDAFERRHLAEHRLAKLIGDPKRWARHAWMADGGILDNRPFSYVVVAIERKPADHEVFRIVAYVEPAPEADVTPSPAAPPRPLAVAQGLFGLLRHEPIYADLGHLDERNDKVRRIQAMLEGGRDNALRAAQHAGAVASPALRWPPRPEDLDRWRAATNAYAAREPLSGYPGYVALKARRAVDLLASMVCRALDYPYEARHGYFVRHLLRDWFAMRGALDAPGFLPGRGHRMDEQLKLLRAFDVDFRLRRLRTLVGALREVYAKSPPPAERAALDACKTVLARSALAYDAAVADAATLREALRHHLGAAVTDDIDHAIEDNRFDTAEMIERYDARFAALYDALAASFATLGVAQNASLGEALGLLPEPAQAQLLVVLAAYPFFDMVAFPLMDAAGIADLIPVETMRISPRDARFLSADPERLQGSAFGHFAAFLSRAARENDLMWGRLDGVERLIQAIVAAAATPAADQAALDAIRRRFTREALAAVLEQEGARPGTSVGKTATELRARLAGAD